MTLRGLREAAFEETADTCESVRMYFSRLGIQTKVWLQVMLPEA